MLRLLLVLMYLMEENTLMRINHLLHYIGLQYINLTLIRQDTRFIFKLQTMEENMIILIYIQLMEMELKMEQ